MTKEELDNYVNKLVQDGIDATNKHSCNDHHEPESPLVLFFDYLDETLFNNVQLNEINNLFTLSQSFREHYPDIYIKAEWDCNEIVQQDPFDLEHVLYCLSHNCILDYAYKSDLYKTTYATYLVYFKEEQ